MLAVAQPPRTIDAMTTNICHHHAAGTSAPTEQVPAGVHMLAVAGNFDGATVELSANVGGVSAPLGTWEQPGAVLYWLPRCKITAHVTGGTAQTSISAAAAPVAGNVKPRDSYARLKFIGKGV